MNNLSKGDWVKHNDHGIGVITCNHSIDTMGICVCFIDTGDEQSDRIAHRDSLTKLTPKFSTLKSLFHETEHEEGGFIIDFDKINKRHEIDFGVSPNPNFQKGEYVFVDFGKPHSNKLYNDTELLDKVIERKFHSKKGWLYKLYNFNFFWEEDVLKKIDPIHWSGIDEYLTEENCGKSQIQFVKKEEKQPESNSIDELIKSSEESSIVKAYLKIKDKDYFVGDEIQIRSNSYKFLGCPVFSMFTIKEINLDDIVVERNGIINTVIKIGAFDIIRVFADNKPSC